MPPVQSAPGRKGPPDKDRCPPGWDANLWHLTLRFEQYARADGIELRAGRPVIYAELASLVTNGMREKAARGGYRQEVDGCTRRELAADMAARCWYHYPPGDPAKQVTTDLTWVQVAEVIMAEFWSRIQDEHALDRFRQHFREYGKAAVDHWRSLRVIRSIDDHAAVAPRPPIVRRKTASATMPGTSKEG